MDHLPQKAQLNRAINQLAASLPKVQYTYKGSMSGDEVKDTMRIRKARSGEQIIRESQYEVNHHNFVNHKRRLKKIIKRATNALEMQSQITAYIARAKKDFETQEALKTKLLSFWKRVIRFMRNAINEIGNMSFAKLCNN